ncbi:hypothetical protein E7T09_21680 [Deinococcus sp. KSM4-11]|uniref:hypothetical protein n=1 Tax=Deinococcus sp. KSM4-11 TaxID=2568654 RepID=UPI0010A41D16|nr:hypothetical protein [Deinococcus sp. KSM4-11]THF83634.1 hypothetical protein E7T09_21680 [Deinococcus sp. KSM4-11]
MKRVLMVGMLGVLPLGLMACSASSGAPNGGRPPLPTGAEVRFPAAPGNAYLNLLTDAGESVYQISVPSGSTSAEVDPAKWAGATTEAKAQPVASLLPAGVTGTPTISTPTAKVLLLHWLMWQDKNTNGTREAGEDLAVLSHDRVAYASAAVTVDFTTATPDMHQTWTLSSGWSRAEHFVFLPENQTTYQRTLSSSTLNRTTLHLPTPETSQ